MCITKPDRSCSEARRGTQCDSMKSVAMPVATTEPHRSCSKARQGTPLTAYGQRPCRHPTRSLTPSFQTVHAGLTAPCPCACPSPSMLCPCFPACVLTCSHLLSTTSPTCPPATCPQARPCPVAPFPSAPTCSSMAHPHLQVGLQQPINEVPALIAHDLGVIRPRDAPVQNILKDLLGGVGVEGRHAWSTKQWGSSRSKAAGDHAGGGRAVHPAPADKQHNLSEIDTHLAPCTGPASNKPCGVSSTSTPLAPSAHTCVTYP